MKKINIEEYNNMCFEFLYGYTQNLENIKFDSDWNNIMKIVKKIYSYLEPSHNLKFDLIQRVGRGDIEGTIKIIWEFLNNDVKNHVPKN
jgi:hypothetical protein